MTLYAKWTENAVTVIEYTVTFDSNDGSSVTPVKVKEGGLIGKPGDPAREGYTFAGWFSDEKLEQEWDFSAGTVTQDMTLYAKWTENAVTETKYTVTFESNGGSSVPSVEVKVKRILSALLC